MKGRRRSLSAAQAKKVHATATIAKRTTDDAMPDDSLKGQAWSGHAGLGWRVPEVLPGAAVAGMARLQIQDPKNRLPGGNRHTPNHTITRVIQLKKTSDAKRFSIDPWSPRRNGHAQVAAIKLTGTVIRN
jgi:hypothetical protein